MKKLLAVGLTVAMAVTAFTACGPKENVEEDLSKYAVERTDFTSVYSKIGSKVSVDQVTERDGAAYATVDGKEYELGMDFLSMAMVYNMATSEKFPTTDDVYNEWWRLYIQRWNDLVPEVPLYSNQYFDVYNAKIDSMHTTPFYSPTDVVVGAKVVKGDNKVILGSATDLSGAFRAPAFGKPSPGASDNDISKLTSGYATIYTDAAGALRWADADNKDAGTTVVLEHNGDGEKTADGTLKATIKIADNLKFSNGDPINAKNYIVGILVGSTAVYGAVNGKQTAGLNYVGYDSFTAYEGKAAEGATKEFKGVRLLDDYTFSVEVTPDYADYYYARALLSFGPEHLSLYNLKDADIKDDGNGAYLADSFYEKIEDKGLEVFKNSQPIKDNIMNNDANAFPFSGPYVVSNYDKASKTATLKKNDQYLGDYRGKPSIETISYVPVASETQLDLLKQGGVDVIAGITGGDETKAALAVVAKEKDAEGNPKFAENHYDRAGYGKLAFVSDFGSTQFKEVRQAVMYTINRTDFANTFTGGYGKVVDGPYYEGSAAFVANKDKIQLNKYAYSAASAKQVLEAGGWIYNAKGEKYTDGIRYKKLTGYEKSAENLNFHSKDGKYKTVKVGDDFYMPLVINWMGTQPNPVTDQLLTAWHGNSQSTSEIGMYITYASGDFNTAVMGEYCQVPDYGFKEAVTGAVNFATGFNSAIYDYAFNWTIDPDMYDAISICYLKDEADFFVK